MGVIYTAPDGTAVTGRTHHECETDLDARGIDTAGCTVELTEITHEVNRWPGVRQTTRPERCIWA